MLSNHKMICDADEDGYTHVSCTCGWRWNPKFTFLPLAIQRHRDHLRVVRTFIQNSPDRKPNYQ